MDYDQSNIATVYDEARRLAPEVLLQWLDLLSARIAQGLIRLIVDVGCGTGRFTQPLAERFAADAVGIDPSQKMLDQARQKLTSDRVSFVRAAAEALPIGDNSTDVVFMSMVYHHLADPGLIVKECLRVLRDDGYLFVRNSTQETDFPHRHFFPTMKLLIESELPKRRDVRSVFESAGFKFAAHEIVKQVVASNWRHFVLKSSLRADSFLARLPDADYEAGMKELRSHAARISTKQQVVEEVDLFVFIKPEILAAVRRAAEISSVPEG